MEDNKRKRSKGRSKIRSKWPENDVSALYESVIIHGHRNFKEIVKALPHKTENEIMLYLSSSTSHARAFSKCHPVLDPWLSTIKNKLSAAGLQMYSDSKQIPQVLKYLSIDGIIDNHPLPETCNDVDFGAAYRMLYQACMGFPFQAVNKATADFVCNSLGELTLQVERNKAYIEQVQSHLKSLYPATTDGGEERTEEGPERKKHKGGESEEPPVVCRTKPVRVYQRKKKGVAETGDRGEDPVLKMTVVPVVVEGQTISDCLLRLDGQPSEQPAVRVQLPLQYIPVQNLERELMKELALTVGYNPLQLPLEWIVESPSALPLNPANPASKGTIRKPWT